MLFKKFVRIVRVGQFVVALAIFTAAALMPATVIKASQADSVLHFAGNLLLLVSAWLAFFGRWNIGLIFALLVPYSLIVEVAQWLAPSRLVDGRDMLANLLGLATGAVIAFGADRLLQRMPRVRSYLTKH